MVDEKEKEKELEEGKRGKRFKKHKGRGNSNKDPNAKIKAQEFIPDDEHVSAVSLMELPAGSELEQSVVLSVLHSSVRLDSLYNRAMHSNSDVVRDVVKKVARQYFVQVAPTTVAQIMEQIDLAITASIKVFAAICYLWKVQNGLEVVDEKDVNLSPVFFATYNLHTCYGRKVMQNGRMGNNDDLTFIGGFSISNSSWKRDILSNLHKIYVPKQFADWAYTVIGHFIKFDYADEDQVRLWDVYPSDLEINLKTGTKPTNWTLDTYLELIDNQVDIVTNAFNTYPFIEEVLSLLGITKPGDSYDFTRDLAQMHLNVLEDRDHALENMCYMINTNVNQNEDLPASAYYRIISTQLPSAYLYVYPDSDGKVVKSLKYVNRITVNVNSLTNAFRGTTRATSITYFQKNNNNNTYAYCIMGAVNVHVINHPTNEAGGLRLHAIAQQLWLLNIIDMPNDAVCYVCQDPTGLTPYTQDTDLFTGSDYLTITPTGGCFIISSDDIATVASDACAFMLFNTPKLPPVSQTLGKDAKTSKDVK